MLRPSTPGPSAQPFTVCARIAVGAPVWRTADFGYLRLRRQDYDSAALLKWAEFVKTYTGEVFVYFKHEDSAAGTEYARRFASLAKS